MDTHELMALMNRPYYRQWWAPNAPEILSDIDLNSATEEELADLPSGKTGSDLVFLFFGFLQIINKPNLTPYSPVASAGELSRQGVGFAGALGDARAAAGSSLVTILVQNTVNRENAWRFSLPPVV